MFDFFILLFLLCGLAFAIIAFINVSRSLSEQTKLDKEEALERIFKPNDTKKETSVEAVAPKTIKPKTVSPTIDSPKTIKPKIETPAPAITWSIKLLRDLEWKRFEELCVAYYQMRSYQAVPTSLGADGGIDIKLYKQGESECSMIVQCKSWASDVGVKQIREFLGVKTHERISKALYMTTSGYTQEALNVAKSNNITCFTGEMLLTDILRLPDDQKQQLLELATEGDYITPTCAKCGIKMIRKKGDKGEFWGCKNFPRGCKQKLQLRKIDCESPSSKIKMGF